MSLAQSPYQNQPLVNDTKAEQYVIGSLLVDPTAYTLVSQYLDEDCFTTPCVGIYGRLLIIWESKVCR